MTPRLRMTKRQWHIIALLRSCGWLPLSRLASDIGCCQRTVRRDLYALEEMGLPLMKENEGPQGHVYQRWRILRGAPCPCCGHEPKYTGVQR